jgi:hypothetical protein
MSLLPAHCVLPVRSVRWLALAALPSALALSSGLAGATSLNFGVSYAPSVAELTQDGLLRVGVQEYPLAGFSLAAGLSTRAVDASVSRSLVLPGLGAARLRVEGAGVYAGGLRGGVNLSGTAGPIALTLSGSAWNIGLGRVDPLARWAEVAPDLRESGATFGVTARYRLNRDLVLAAVGTLGGQSNLLAQAELRRGELNYRLGLRAGQDVLGAAAGVTYSNPDTGLTASLDGLAGPNTLGVTGNLGVDGLLGEGSSLRVFAAYEPWRSTSERLRYGAQVGLTLGRGTLNLEGYGGTTDGMSQGFGFKAGYVLPLGAASDEAAPDQVTPDEVLPDETEPAQP